MSLICAATLLMAAGNDTFAFGADLSFLKLAEERGAVFKDQGAPTPGLRIFRNHGYNWIRLRLFVHPTDLPNSLEYTISEAKAAKVLGYKFLLDFHLADGWADPGKQPIPSEWAKLDHNNLVSQVRDYTRESIESFRNAGVMPDMVQVGNEITNGMLWPDGKLPARWDSFLDLEKAGIEGVMQGAGADPKPKIMVHIDRGGDWPMTKLFFDKLTAAHVKFDVIGQSYYPWWHGSLTDMKENLDQTIARYHKPVMLAEVAYNWTPGEYLNRPAPYPETPAGQRQFLDEVTRVVMHAPEGLGKGVFWWEPAVSGGLGRRGMFKPDGDALPVIDVFDMWTRH